MHVSANRSLVEYNPFWPKGFTNQQKQPQQKQPQRPPEQIELIGIAHDGDTWIFNISNKTKNKAKWVKLNDTRAEYKVTSYDPVTREIVAKINGRTLQLELVKASKTPLEIRQIDRAAQTATTPTTPEELAPDDPLNANNVVPKRRIPPGATPVDVNKLPPEIREKLLEQQRKLEAQQNQNQGQGG